MPGESAGLDQCRELLPLINPKSNKKSFFEPPRLRKAYISSDYSQVINPVEEKFLIVQVHEVIYNVVNVYMHALVYVFRTY